MPQHNSDINISVETLSSSKSIDVAQLNNPIDVEVKRKIDYKDRDHGDLEGREKPNQHPISSISNLSTELQDLENKDTELDGKIAAEANTRAAADTTLQNNINAKPNFSDIHNGKLTIKKNGTTIAEFTANQEGDTTANIIADTPAWGNITGDIKDQEDLQEEFTTINQSIQTETQARTNADTQLSNRIQTNTNNLSTEVTTRQNADTALDNKINTEIQNRTNADTSLSNRITTNATNISDERNLRIATDNTLQQNITAEATTRGNADTSLSNRISTNANNIMVETNARIAADTEIEEDVTSIQTTMSTYGNIVTHNVSEFATSAQGTKADTAIQPNDNITKLNNNAGYITKSVNNLDNYTTTTDMNTLLDDKVTKNNAITGNTKTKITYDGKGLVTSGSDLIESDIPNLHLSKVTDVTASAQEVNYLTGTTSNVQSQINEKLNITDVINNITTTTTNQALSANMGKELQDQINNLKQRGRYLSIWNCTTGLAETIPTVNPYTYKAGDYFLVGTVSATNYRPNGSTYDKDVPSTTVETGSVVVNDAYYYDGTSWTLLHTEQPTVAFSTLAGSPYDNTNLTTALNAKVTANNVITGATKCKITYDSKGLVTSGTDLTANDIPNLTLNKITDVTATASELNILDGATLTTTELNYVDGVTSNIQTQLDNKVTKNNAITAGTHTKITYDSKGLVTGGANLNNSDITTALGYTPYNSTNPSGYQANVLEGVQINSTDLTITNKKVNIPLATNSTLGVIKTDNTTIQANNNGVITAKSLDGLTASITELNYTDGVTSNIQTQLNNKVTKNADITGATHTKITYDSKGLVTGGSDLVASDIPDLSATYYLASNPSGYITSSALNNYVTTNTAQTISATKTISFNESGQGSQASLLNIISSQNASGTQQWIGRTLIGANTLTFLMGTYNGMAGIGAHSWTNALTQQGAAWANFYMNPDGDKAVYIGGFGWTPNSGWLKVQNSGSTSGGKVYYNKGTSSSPTWYEVATTNDLSGKEDTSNKVTSISSSSTDTQYPSAKCVYDIVGNIESALLALRGNV